IHCQRTNTGNDCGARARDVDAKISLAGASTTAAGAARSLDVDGAVACRLHFAAVGDAHADVLNKITRPAAAVEDDAAVADGLDQTAVVVHAVEVAAGLGQLLVGVE